jgi:hypothetical protein
MYQNLYGPEILVVLVPNEDLVDKAAIQQAIDLYMARSLSIYNVAHRAEAHALYAMADNIRRNGRDSVDEKTETDHIKRRFKEAMAIKKVYMSEIAKLDVMMKGMK